MFGLDTLNVLIGLVTVYLTFGIACTAIVEAMAAWLDVRSTNLELALKEFLAGELNQNSTFAAAFYEHPLIQALSKGKDGRPSYIPSEIVAQVVEALITAKDTAVSFAEAVNSLPGSPDTNRIKGLLGVLVTQARGDAAAFRKAVETHFNATMDRTSGWFKRYAQNVALAVAALLVIGANVDTVDIAISLSSNPAVRTKIVEIAAQQLVATKCAEDKVKVKTTEGSGTVEKAKEKTGDALLKLEQAVSNMETTGLRFGWKECPKTAIEWLAKLVGLLVSILAISLGAPFWFDMLQRFMQVRVSGITPREKLEGKK